MLRFVNMTRRPWVGALALFLVGAVVFATATMYLRRTVVLAEERGSTVLVGVHSVPVRSAELTSDRRHLVVSYVGGIMGCGDFSSVRVTKRRDEVFVKVQLGQERSGICNLGGRPQTRTVALNERVGTSVQIVRATKSE